MFILYCKDDSIPGVSADQWAESVYHLAEFLNQSGQIRCTLDYYEANPPPPNWDKWTSDRFMESNFVILVMSPLLADGLRSGQRRSVSMAYGQFYCDTVYRFLHGSLCVAVFLNGCEPRSGDVTEWLPHSMAMARYFKLHNFADLVNGFDQESDDQAEEDNDRFHQYLQKSLYEPRFSSMVELVGHLRGQSGMERPPEPKKIVTLPSQHIHRQPVPAMPGE